jgi:hypothetical protein
MRIRFETAIDDWLELSRYEFANSSVRRWGVKLPVVVCYFLFAVILVSVVPFRWPDIGVFWQAVFMASGCGALIVPAFGILKLIDWIHSWHIRQILQGHDGVLRVDWHEMQCHDGILHVTTELMMCRIDVRAIEDVVISGRWAFILVASRQSFVVPLHRFPDREGHELIAELQESWENCNLPLSNESPPLQLPAPDERFKEVR